MPKIDPRDRAKVECWMRRPEDSTQQAHIQARVLQYVKEQLGFANVNDGSAPSAATIWIAFDQDDQHVALDPPFTRHKDWKARWAWEVSVSKRGSFLTCDSVTFSPGDSNDYCRDVEHDDPIRHRAVEWAREMASALDLKYLDAKTLKAWEVRYEDIDPNFNLDREGGQLPTAFQVLFYE